MYKHKPHKNKTQTNTDLHGLLVSSLKSCFTKNMPRLLSLFDGTGSIRKPFFESGIWDIDQLDIDGRHGANIVCNILNWEYTSFEPWDCIFEGVPCEQCSICRTRAKKHRNFKLDDTSARPQTDVFLLKYHV